MWYKFEKDWTYTYGCIVEADWEEIEEEPFCSRYWGCKFDAEGWAEDNGCKPEDITEDDVEINSDYWLEGDEEDGFYNSFN